MLPTLLTCSKKIVPSCSIRHISISNAKRDPFAVIRGAYITTLNSVEEKNVNIIKLNPSIFLTTLRFQKRFFSTDDQNSKKNQLLKEILDKRIKNTKVLNEILEETKQATSYTRKAKRWLYFFFSVLIMIICAKLWMHEVQQRSKTSTKQL